MLEVFAIPSIVVTLILHGDVGEALLRPFDIYLGQGPRRTLPALTPTRPPGFPVPPAHLIGTAPPTGSLRATSSHFFRAGMMLFCFGVLGMAAVWLISRQAQFGARTTLFAVHFQLLHLPDFLPGMHERYGLAVLVLLVVGIRPPRAGLPLPPAWPPWTS